LKAIRELLLAAFTAEELRRFCSDRPTFRPVTKRFGPGHGLDDMVDEVMTYCDTYIYFPELLDESATQALDQIVSDRMGFDQGPGARWRTADGGMHMLAAAIYQMLVEDGFGNKGGRFSDWFDSAIERGLLSPAEVKRRAALIVGKDAVDRWEPE
jgi:hypothetical protein